MADEPPSGAEAEAAAIRRRWITLAEILGVAGLIVSGLALWNSYQERTSEAADKAEARREAMAEALTVVLRGTADRDGARLTLAPADPAQTIQSQTIAFPATLGVAPVDTVADPRIEARWFRSRLLRATAGDEERASNREGDRQLPIAIVTRFYSGGSMFTDSAVYALIYRVDDPAAARARIDALWAGRRGGPRPGG